jgi:hypothetical protein
MSLWLKSECSFVYSPHGLILLRALAHAVSASEPSILLGFPFGMHISVCGSGLLNGR